jgi:glutamine cyclotransferase
VPLLAISLLLPLAACGGSADSVSTAVIHSRYNKIVLGIDRDEKQFQQGLTRLITGAKASGKLPGRRKLATVLQPCTQV